jgi:hypothetical protein
MYHLNKYSNALILAYTLAFIMMQLGTQSSWAEALTSLPVIIFVVVWSETLTDSLEKTSFKRDMFIISYSCLLAFTTSLILQGNNVDAKGWWSFLIILSGIYSLLGGLLFSLPAILLNKNHSSYTNTFAIIFFLGYLALSILPNFNLTHFSQVNLFLFFITSLFSFHLLRCLGHQFKKSFNS